MKVILDRFESDYAIIEVDEDNIISVPRILVGNAKEGDVIKIEVDKSNTDKRKKDIQKLMDSVFED